MSPLFFMHITKTAGGSLKQMLRDSDASVKFHYPEEPGYRAHFDYQDDPEIIFGHYIYGVHENMDRKPRYGCFLREPISRTLSHINHLQNNDRGPLGERLRTFDRIETAIVRMRHWEFDNFLCRLISGAGNTPKFGEVGYNVYEKARQNLTHQFEFIGIFEEMATSLQRLNDLVPSLGLTLPSVNRGVYQKEISPKTSKLLNSLTRYDQMLYQDALALFKRP